MNTSLFDLKLPLRHELMIHAELLEDSRNNRICQFFNRLRLKVESRRCGENRSSGFSELGQIPQVNEVKRRFAHNEDEFALLLQADVSGPRYEIVRDSVCYSAGG